MKIKVCGITDFEQMQQLQDLGVDYAGMIFYESSKRFVGNKMESDKVKIRNLEINRVGVFVNADRKTIEKAIDDYGLNTVQLHGDENVDFCNMFRSKVGVIKVFRVSKEKNVDKLIEPFQNSCHYFLFDTDTKEYGGSGNQFDWKMLEQTQVNKPFFLSGGIGLTDVEKIKMFHHPDFYAVDINSGFETQPGVKDMQKVLSFIQSLNHG